MERYLYTPRTLFPYKGKNLLQRHKVWIGYFTLLEQYFLARKKFFSAQKGTEWKSIFTLLEKEF